MLPKRCQFLPVLIMGLMVLSSPAHADSTIFDSLNKTLKEISHNVRDRINEYYGESTHNRCQGDITTATIKIPVPVAPVVPKEPELYQCKKYLGLVYDPSMETDAKKIATIYLNGVLDFMDVDLDTPPSPEEIIERNKCVELALAAGADPDSNGMKKDSDNTMPFEAPVPLAKAVHDNDEVAVKILLKYKANPNAQDTSSLNPISLLKTSLFISSQEIALDMINAGSDLTVPDLMWSAAGNAADKVVDALIKSKKIPVNQISKFGDASDDEGETALDASERGVYALKSYQKKFAGNSSASLSDKIEEVNHILYYTYPFKNRLPIPKPDSSNSVDPDAYISELLSHQQNISDTLKAAGWSCKQENCGIIELN